MHKLFLEYNIFILIQGVAFLKVIVDKSKFVLSKSGSEFLVNIKQLLFSVIRAFYYL